MVSLIANARFDSRVLDLYGFIGESELSNQAPNGFRATFGPGDYVNFKGVGYKYFGPEPYEGTTQQATVFIDNSKVFQLSGLKITIDDVLDYANMTARQVAADIFDGKDTLNGSSANDYLEGFDGNDTYILENTGDQVVERANEGDDTVLAAVDYRLANNVFVEHLATTNARGKADIDLTGNSYKQTITGNAGDNALDGGGGDDVLSGGRGVDTFEFRASPSSNVVEIRDFDIGREDDRIELSRADFRGLDLGQLDRDDFAEHFSYSRSSGKLSFDQNGDDPGGSVHFATFINKAQVTFDDIFVVA